MLRLPQRAVQIITLAYTLAIVVMSLVPSTGMPSENGLDKVEHFLAYALLSVLVSYSLAGRKDVPLLSFLFGTILGAILEILQGMGGVRTCSTWDWAADSLGALAGSIILHIKLRHNL